MKYSKDAVPQGLLGSRTFITPLSQLTVSLSVDENQALQAHDYGWHEPIAVELVVTAFKRETLHFLP